jgi:hypothetical protein
MLMAWRFDVLDDFNDQVGDWPPPTEASCDHSRNKTDGQ